MIFEKKQIKCHEIKCFFGNFSMHKGKRENVIIKHALNQILRKKAQKDTNRC